VIEYKGFDTDGWHEISNPLYKIGPATFDFHGIVRINGVKYYEDSIDLRKEFAKAQEKQQMWEKLQNT